MTEMKADRREFHVLGPPGTGKTTFLSKQIESARAKHGNAGVLVVSFTRTAAAEIGGRIGGQEAPGRAFEHRTGGYTYDPDKPASEQVRGSQGDSVPRVGTLHSILYHALDRPEIADTKAKDWNEQVAPPYRITGSSNSKASAMDEADWGRAGKEGDKLYGSIQRLRARMIGQEFWPLAERQFYRQWCDWKERDNLLDFTDLIAQGIERQVPPPEGVRVGIVDEAQDFTRLELTLIRKWAPLMETAVIAYDDDQALFSFKGAVADTLIESLPPEDRRRVLAQSFRVPRAVHALANDWISRVSNRAPKEYRPRDYPGQVLETNANSRRPNDAIDVIREDLAAGKTVMVLAACSYMLKRTITELRDAGIPFHNAYRPTRGDWNPLRKSGTSVAARLGAFLQRDPRLSSEGEAMLHLWTAKDAWLFAEHLGAEVFRNRGDKERLHEEAKLKPDERARRFIEDGDFFRDEHLPWIGRGDILGYVDHLLPSKKKAYEFVLNIAAANPKALTEEPRVTVGTIHSVKGGQADTVIVFPDLSPEGARQWRPAHGSRGRDDIRRLFYVAFTRAREKLVLCQRNDSLSVEWNA
jgi:superfamily I DNA/RNA helicase